MNQICSNYDLVALEICFGKIDGPWFVFPSHEPWTEPWLIRREISENSVGKSPQPMKHLKAKYQHPTYPYIYLPKKPIWALSSPSQQTSRASLAPPSNSAPIGFGSGCTAQTAQTLGALDHGTIWHIYIGVNPPSLALCLFHDQLDQEFGDSTTSHVNPQFAHRWRFCFIHVQTHHEVSTTLCFNCAHLVVSAHAQHIKLSMNPLIQHLIPSTKQWIHQARS